MNCEELPIYRDAWELISLMDRYITNFPREFKYSHGAKLRELGIDLVRYLCLANNCSSNPAKRAAQLEAALGMYEAYKLTKRLCYAGRCISADQSSKVDFLLAKVGRQLMGWKQSEERKRQQYQ